tara:strand:- start:1735 stop:2115 length:381 start_codon:yes stop_codon:yes gene_type:complete
MENRPLSPHIQIYKWHISSLVSISHRITGIINFFAITLICLWFAFMLLGETNYQIINNFLETFLGKFILISITWSFSFQMLSEIRHLIMDYGYGFELQKTKVTGLLVIFGSIILTILIYLFGRGFV